jgi:hypothetical protein
MKRLRTLKSFQIFKTEIKNQKPIADDTLSRPTYCITTRKIMITQDETLADTLPHTNRLCPPPGQELQHSSFESKLVEMFGFLSITDLK